MSETGQGRTIVKNASVMMVGQLISWVLAMLTTIFVPRYLGPEVLGQFALVNSIWAIATMFAGFGTDTLLTKEIARNPERTSQLVAVAISVRMLFFVLSALIIAVYIYLMGYSQTIIYLFFLVGMGQLIGHFALVAGSALSGLERMSDGSIAGILGKIVYTSLVLLVIVGGLGIYAVAGVSIVSGTASVILLFYFLSRQKRIWSPFKPSDITRILKDGTPFLLSSLVLLIYQQVDVIVMSNLIDYQTVGWYNSARNITGTLLFIPTIFIGAVFPALSRSHAQGSSLLPKITSKTIDMMLLCGVPIGLGLMTVANPLALLLFGAQFAPSGPALAVLGIGLIPVYLTIIMGYFLIATDRLSAWLVVMVVGIIATLILDIILVPLCARMFNNGAIGGGLSYIVTESAMVVAGIFLLPRKILGWHNLWYAARVFGAGIVMVVVTWWFRDMFIAIPIVVGGVVYVGLIAALRVVPPEDLKLLTGMVESKFGRFLNFRKEQPADIKIP
jgi:O-antigen/teichoic acid export membrane protein